MASHLKGPLFVGGKMVNVPIDAGHVYYVCQTGQSYYDEIYAQMKGTYPDDDSYILHTTIQSALDATVSDRNDYVIVLPDSDDYDLTAALTMTKKSVHLIGAGGEAGKGSTNAVRIHQATAATAIITLSAAACEISGFFFKVAASTQAITLITGGYSCNIHHNSFPMVVTGATNAAMIVGTTDGGGWGDIHDNIFYSYSGNSATMAVAAVDINHSATFTRVCNNDVTIGDGNTATICIRNLAVKGRTDFNTFLEAAVDGGASAGVITNCVTTALSGSGIGNEAAWSNTPGSVVAVGQSSGAVAPGKLRDIEVVGNVYYVIKDTETFYDQFLAEHQTTYADGTEAVHTVVTGDGADVALQAALDACVTGRNDYVIVLPSEGDYDLEAVLTMSKKGVHLISPAGYGYEIGCPNATRFHATTDVACINVTNSCVEIAGIYFKNYAGQSALTLAAEAYAQNIHHNFFSVTNNSTTGNLPLIVGTGTGGGYGAIVRNRFFDVAGNAGTFACHSIQIGTGAVGCQVQWNDITVRLGNTATLCIDNNGQAGSCDHNYIREAQANLSQGTAAGIITHGISMQTCGTMIGNRAALSTGKLGDATSGLVDTSWVDNRTGLNGGAVVEDADT